MLKTDTEVKVNENGDGFDIKIKFSLPDPFSPFDLLEMKRLSEIYDEPATASSANSHPK